jgi:hypothetical protein
LNAHPRLPANRRRSPQFTGRAGGGWVIINQMYVNQSDIVAMATQ